ncbi:MAG: hypothetical protein LUQ09_06745 [Methanomassiliicoccales archaeon]|nr:hypothetical protein [Methanomassiliicoccales archaeon]
MKGVTNINEHMTIEEAKSEFEGRSYSKELAIQIERLGFGFATSAATGRIVMLYKPLSPKRVSI